MHTADIIRLGIFLLVLVAMLAAEFFAPRRAHRVPKSGRVVNLGVGALNVLMLAAVPVTAAAAALFAIHNQLGLLPWLQFSLWTNIIIAVLVLDLGIYWQHRLLHKIPPLWRLHRMHHTDTAVDVTTALRFHPLEILLSVFIKAAVIIFLGAPLLAVLLFEIILNASAMFNHGNVRLSQKFDRALRWLIVTPDMHRVHHSIHRQEHDANYGFCLSIWDRIFTSYIPTPRDGHTAMQLGQREYRSAGEVRIAKLLTQPFR